MLAAKPSLKGGVAGWWVTPLYWERRFAGAARGAGTGVMGVLLLGGEAEVARTAVEAVVVDVVDDAAVGEGLGEAEDLVVEEAGDLLFVGDGDGAAGVELGAGADDVPFVAAEAGEVGVIDRGDVALGELEILHGTLHILGCRL